MEEEVPEFASPAQEAEFWRGRAEHWRKAAKDAVEHVVSPLVMSMLQWVDKQCGLPRREAPLLLGPVREGDGELLREQHVRSGAQRHVP